MVGRRKRDFESSGAGGLQVKPRVVSGRGIKDRGMAPDARILDCLIPILYTHIPNLTPANLPHEHAAYMQEYMIRRFFEPTNTRSARDLTRGVLLFATAIFVLDNYGLSVYSMTLLVGRFIEPAKQFSV